MQRVDRTDKAGVLPSKKNYLIIILNSILTTEESAKTLCCSITKILSK